MFGEIELGGEFFERLLAIDAEITAKVASEGCRFCGGRLHRGDYTRKPRGGLVAVPSTRIGNGGKEDNTCTAPPKPTVTLADNEFTTKPGYVIALTEAQLDMAVGLVAADDKAALDKYVKATPGVSITAGNDVVTIADTSGVLASKVRTRKKGGTAAYWTVREALERP